MYIPVRLWWTVAANLIVGFIYMGNDASLKGTLNKIGAIFFYITIISHSPFNMGAAIVSFVAFYFLTGLDRTGERVVYFLLMALTAYWFSSSTGQLLSFLCPNMGAAAGLGSLLMTLFTLTMGFLITADKIPPWWIWIYLINPLRYMLQGMTVNEMGGGKVIAVGTGNATITGDYFL